MAQLNRGNVDLYHKEAAVRYVRLQAPDLISKLVFSLTNLVASDIHFIISVLGSCDHVVTIVGVRNFMVSTCTRCTFV